MEYYEIAGVGDIGPGTMKSFRVSGKEILISNIDGKYYAIDNKCTHLGGDLSKGMLEGKVIQCPRHGSQFDATTGKNLSGPTKSIFKLIKKVADLNKYDVKIENDKIKVMI